MRQLVLTCIACVAVGVVTTHCPGQDSLESVPGYDRYQLVRDNQFGLAEGGTVSKIRWNDDGTSVDYHVDGERRSFDLQTLLPCEPGEEQEARPKSPDGPRRASPGRGRQSDREPSPDGQWVAVSRDWNIVLEDRDGQLVRPITEDGTRKHRYGQASWVYGEELSQKSAMWWSPDSRYLAYYEFDETEVEDFYLLRGLSKLRPSTMVEGYPKPGEPNPRASLHIHDLQTERTVSVDTGRFGDDPSDTGHYVYNVRFAPDGLGLIYSRTNRLQNVLEVMTADLVTGESQLVVRERQDTWQKNRPLMRFLEDGERFVWETERSGFRQYELRSLDGERLATLSSGSWPVWELVKVDEANDVVFFTGASGDSPFNAHLHRVSLDGADPKRLTQEPMNHRVRISPDSRWFISEYQTLTDPPATALYSTDGRRIATLAESDTSRFDELGLVGAEMFSFEVEGQTLFGVLYKPSTFDPDDVYPLLVDVYGGPFSHGIRNRYGPVRAKCELGMLVARIQNRGTLDRGKAFESANYLQLGTVDLNDQVAGVRALVERPYVDAGRVGISGHSYGGYMAALAILRHPDVFHVAVASAAVTDWKNYDTVYTERYMRTPQENPEGYAAGSCMTYADQLRGKLLLQHGMADDNVHPTNAWQLADALHQAGRPFDMMFYPERGHSLGAGARRLRLLYLCRHLLEPVDY